MRELQKELANDTCIMAWLVFSCSEKGSKLSPKGGS